MLLPLNFLGGTLFLSPGGHFFDVRGYLGGHLGTNLPKKLQRLDMRKKHLQKLN